MYRLSVCVDEAISAHSNITIPATEPALHRKERSILTKTMKIMEDSLFSTYWMTSLKTKQ